jgi:hypothetical protein
VSVKFTLTLETDGREVWKRWTGDRDEVIRMAIPALVELEVGERVAQMFLMSASQEVVQGMVPDSFATSDAFSADLRTKLTLDVRSKG